MARFSDRWLLLSNGTMRKLRLLRGHQAERSAIVPVLPALLRGSRGYGPVALHPEPDPLGARGISINRVRSQTG